MTSAFDQLATAILDGKPATEDDALAVLRAHDDELMDLVAAAGRLRRSGLTAAALAFSARQESGQRWGGETRLDQVLSFAKAYMHPYSKLRSNLSNLNLILRPKNNLIDSEKNC